MVDAAIRHFLAALLSSLLLVPSASEAKPPALPLPLKILQGELQRYAYCADEVSPEGEDWWGFWWSLPDRGCGDCEDFAAYSYGRLEQLGIARTALKLEAAAIGKRRLRGGAEAELLHVWLEVDLPGGTWTVWNRQIRPGTWRKGRLLGRAEIEALVDRRFGPNWPYGLDLL